MLEYLKQKVLHANIELPARGLVTYTWGNVSGIDRERRIVAIKPSGVDYSMMTGDDIVLMDLAGTIVEGRLTPSTDAPTHLALYRAFPEIGGVCHTHSRWATSWAQAGKDIPALGTTHADYFYGSVPCTRLLREIEIEDSYEENTGRVIIETFDKLDYRDVPAVLVRNHGPFTWGRDGDEAVYNATVLEEVAMMAIQSFIINPQEDTMQTALLDKHFLRKHGSEAYYGQKCHHSEM